MVENVVDRVQVDVSMETTAQVTVKLIEHDLEEARRYFGKHLDKRITSLLTNVQIWWA